MEEHANWNVQYLRVIGRLYPNLRLRLRPSYLTHAAQWLDREGEGDGLLATELYNAEDALLGSYPLRVYNTCGFGGDSQVQAVRGWIPFHPDTRTVRFTYRGRVLYEIRRSEAPPDVSLTWQPPEQMVGRQRVTWKAEHAQGERIQFFLRYSHTGGRSWQRVGWRTYETETEVDFDQLPGGERCLLAVIGTDGINTTTAGSEPFAVAIKPCQAIVLAPVDGSTFSPGQTVQLIGQGYCYEEARPEREALYWISSIDGELGRGPRVEVASLSPGEHRITLVAGVEPHQGNETVTIWYGEKDLSAARRE